MSKKLNIVVLMGGKSSEYEISLISGREVVKNLDGNKYNVLPVIVSRDGRNWQLTNSKGLELMGDPLELRASGKELVLQGSTELSGVQELQGKNVDAIFIAMHGPYGEDGTVQGMLELAGLRYTGSGVLASALGMDKGMFRKVLRSVNILTPKYIEVKKGENVDVKILGKLPYFVKPGNQGSSVGNSIVRNIKDLEPALELAFKYSDVALVDEYVEGKEITCAILGNNNPTPLPLIEIIPLKGDFFNYESKYSEGGAEEIIPARISDALTTKIQEIALKVYKEVGCRGFARVDFILKDNKTPLVLEVNTIPGLTPMSLFPKAAKAAGISYQELLSKVIDYSFK